VSTYFPINSNQFHYAQNSNEYRARDCTNRASKLLSVRTMDFHGKRRGGNIKRPLSIPSSSSRASIISRSTIAFELPPSLTGTSRAIITIKPTATRSRVNHSTPRVRVHVVSHKGKCPQLTALRYDAISIRSERVSTAGEPPIRTDSVRIDRVAEKLERENRFAGIARKDNVSISAILPLPFVPPALTIARRELLACARARARRSRPRVIIPSARRRANVAFPAVPRRRFTTLRIERRNR